MQIVLLLLAVAAIPWMLIPKPYLLRKRHQKRQEQLANYGRVSPQDEDGGDEEAGSTRLTPAHHDEEEEFDFSEIAVHQVGNLMPLHTWLKGYMGMATSLEQQINRLLI